MPNDPPNPDPKTPPYAQFWSPIACKMPAPEGGPRGDMGHSGDDWDFSEISELTERQLRSIELIIQGLTDVQIAQRLQINRKTIWRWKTLDPDYRRILSNARIQLYASTTDRYQLLLGAATSILAKYLNDPADDHRFPAAMAVLNMAGAFKPLPPTYFPAPPPAPPALPAPNPPPHLPPKVG